MFSWFHYQCGSSFRSPALHHLLPNHASVVLVQSRIEQWLPLLVFLVPGTTGVWRLTCTIGFD
uniref:Uncharacterized protein n=1 Tax=Arundo donax TaxID=35708 RepID=A0A0A9H0K4_ARUDO